MATFVNYTFYEIEHRFKMDFGEAVLFHESFDTNKIEQLPPGIFSDLSDLRAL